MDLYALMSAGVILPRQCDCALPNNPLAEWRKIAPPLAYTAHCVAMDRELALPIHRSAGVFKAHCCRGARFFAAGAQRKIDALAELDGHSD